MSKKHGPKDSGDVFFDTQSKMVMSQGGTFEKMKEKISAVRAVVPNKSNNEIVLVLQHYDNSVDKAVQAFVDGSAVEILKEWNVTGKKKTRKKKPKPKPPTPANDGLVEPSQTNTEGTQSVTSSEKEGLNGFHANGSLNDMESVDSLSEQLDSISVDHHELEDSESATPEVSDPTEQEEGPCTVEPHGQQTTSVTSQGSKPQRSSNTRSRQSSHPVSSPLLVMPDDLLLGSSGSKKLASNIDKSVKDLQRCMASLTRYRVVVKEEMDSSIKRMKQIFAELQTCLMDREVALLGEMDKVKAEALAILNGRQKKAEELRRLTDKVGTMSEEQLSELRADIKHFVSERKYDEELGRAVKFTYKLEPVKEAIVGFGQVYHPNTSYSSRSRCSSASSTSLTSPSIPELHPQPTPAPQGLGYSPRSAGPRSEHNQRQGYQGNRRPGQGYQPRGPRPSGSHYQGRPDYQNRTSNRFPSQAHNSPTNRTAVSSSKPDQPNGLPPRPVQTNCSASDP
ncbi:spermatogenesis-associated serine-rich protein 2 isoform X2 [Polypterus senegalus]|nr:spermatogenesis-associated serine-rich protein 2 isoform X2 [Polypterus senegalus]